MQLNVITKEIIGAAIEVHKALGPGLLESAYEKCLEFELIDRNLSVRSQIALPVVYKEIKLEHGYRLDLLVNEKVVVEVKAVEYLTDVHQAQILTYMKLSNCKVGLIINFHVKVLKDGIKRFVL